MGARVLLIVVAVAWLGLGTWGLADPEGVATTVGIASHQPGALVEIRAMYGGLQFALGVVAAVGAARAAWHAPVLLLAAACLAGLGLARLGGMAATGSWLVSHVVFTVLELGAAAVCLVALGTTLRTRAAPPAPKGEERTAP